MVDLDKYRGLFIAEGREHLAELSRILVALEGQSAQSTGVDELFRHVHSIKGMAASMGYAPIADVAHRLEDAISAARRLNVPLRDEIVDEMLAATDSIAAQIELVAQGGEVVADTACMERLEGLVRLLERVEVEAQSEDRSGPQDVGSDASIAEGSDGGPAPDGQVVRVNLAPETASPSVRAFLVHRRLSAWGEVLACEPSLETLKKGESRTLQLRFVFTSTSPIAEVAAQIREIPDVADVSLEDDAAVVFGSPEREHAFESDDSPERESAAAAAVVDTIRVRTDVLDTLIDSVGELFIERERLLAQLLGHPDPNLRNTLDSLDARIRQLHEEVMAVRMTPLSTLTDRYPRLVRDLGRQLHKDVALSVLGGDIELDRAILENLETPFVHVLRNAMDHGIELPADRLKAGKTAKAKIHITATRERDSVVVEVADDGQGLDADKLRELAIDRGLIGRADAAELSENAAYFLICLPGFSTRTEVSDVSGRGVGMEAVMSQIEELGGRLDIRSQKGVGSRIIFRLPLTLAIIPTLLVCSGGNTFAIPSSRVSAIRESGRADRRQVRGRTFLRHEGGFLRVRSLAQFLGLQRNPRAEEHVIVVEDSRNRVGLAVERIVGYREVVVKTLGEPLDRLDWFSGAAILGNGAPVLILDVHQAMQGREAA